MGYKSPLYGRRTMQIKLKPFSVFDAKKMLPRADAQKLVELYAAVGGIPMYLSQFDDSDSTAGNLAKYILRQGAYLHIEPENYLLQEVRNPAIYNAVISAIANGYVRPKEIADTTGLNSPQVSQLLDALAELQLVERVTPQVNAKNVRFSTASAITSFVFVTASSLNMPERSRLGSKSRSQARSLKLISQRSLGRFSKTFVASG